MNRCGFKYSVCYILVAVIYTKSDTLWSKLFEHSVVGLILSDVLQTGQQPRFLKF